MTQKDADEEFQDSMSGCITQGHNYGKRSFPLEFSASICVICGWLICIADNDFAFLTVENSAAFDAVPSLPIQSFAGAAGSFLAKRGGEDLWGSFLAKRGGEDLWRTRGRRIK